MQPETDPGRKRSPGAADLSARAGGGSERHRDQPPARHRLDLEAFPTPPRRRIDSGLSLPAKAGGRTSRRAAASAEAHDRRRAPRAPAIGVPRPGVLLEFEKARQADGAGHRPDRRKPVVFLKRMAVGVAIDGRRRIVFRRLYRADRRRFGGPPPCRPVAELRG